MRQAQRFLTLTALVAVLVLSAGCGGGTDEVSPNTDSEPASAVSDDATVSDDETLSDDETSSDDGTDADDAEVSDEGEPIPIDLDALMASSWTLRFGGGPDGDVPIVDGSPITIRFDGERFRGTAACNNYGGGYSVDGSQMTLLDVFHTEMACEEAIQASEAAYLSALLDVDGIDLFDGQLALSGMATELIFVAS